MARKGKRKEQPKWNNPPSLSVHLLVIRRRVSYKATIPSFVKNIFSKKSFPSSCTWARSMGKLKSFFTYFDANEEQLRNLILQFIMFPSFQQQNKCIWCNTEDNSHTCTTLANISCKKTITADKEVWPRRMQNWRSTKLCEINELAKCRHPPIIKIIKDIHTHPTDPIRDPLF